MGSSDRLELRDVGVPGILVLGRYRHSYAHVGLEPHSHPGCVEVCFLARGRQRYRLGGRVYDLTGGEQFVALPDEEHDTANEPQDKGVLYWLIAQLTPEDAPLLYLDRRQRRQVKKALFDIPSRQFTACADARTLLDDAIGALLRPQNALSRLRAAMLLAQYLLGTIAAATAEQERLVSEPVRQSRQYIADHLAEPINVATLAHVAGLSATRLHARFRQEIGQSPGEYILHAKIERARDLLADTDLSVTDIAHSLSFSSAQYFATAFKRLTRATPTSFRRSLHSERGQ
ncbi:AraC family transcriptional regulator [Actinopolymorpha alba]|uniref:AraC family transcriptional regulator n=1 Tax=Actinopolymorpha alba TaxID=533267 RepID=UPI0003640913|nr:AraC family transcriptional regulator [Actinopolymorpha alba]